MGDSLEPIRLQLAFMYTIIKEEEPEIYMALERLGIPPFFAISWILSWFAHDLSDLQDMGRLYDFLIASNPLAPIY
ncbi:GTPase-activating protein gyp8, partial [Spiromyces aspiralis]